MDRTDKVSKVSGLIGVTPDERIWVEVDKI
jgi:hypothetical protein